MGGPLPGLHGGKGHPCAKPARRGQEAPGPMQTLPVCEGDRRPGHGEYDPLGEDMSWERYLTSLQFCPAVVIKAQCWLG